MKTCLWISLTVVLGVSTQSAELRLGLPLGRAAYQCNEWIDLTVSLAGHPAASPGELQLVLAGPGESCLQFAFPARTASGLETQATRLEHLRVNAAALRPGPYELSASWGGATAVTNLTVHSQVRRSDFKLINWGRARGREQLAQGEDSLGFNLFYGHYGADEEANLVRAGVDFMACCVMSGGHQMDLRQECDWSDPAVIRGGTRRVVRRAFVDRTRPNVWGVHFYDEPGLTWAKDPETGEMTAHVVPWQARSYEAAFGEPPPDWKRVDPANPEHVVRWAQWARWKLGFMDAAWKDAQFGVSAARPGYASVTQSQYGYSAFSDGYYFNVVRSLPIISGHGGYHDFGPGYFNPSMFLEFARARDLARPNWYLPTWYGNTSPDEFRLEQYLSFQCNLQGMLSPPDLEMGSAPEKSRAAQGIVEANHLMGRLGPIFNTMPVTRPPVAMLFSLSQMIHAQTLDRKVCYAHDTPHGRNVLFAYLAGKLLQHQFLPVLDEDVLDGTLAAHHKAIVLTSIDHLDGNVVAGLEDFARAGGLVLLTADCTVKIGRAVRLEVAPSWPDAARIAELKKTGRNTEAQELTRLRQALIGAQRLADHLRPHLERANLRPPLSSSEAGLVVTRQAAGDIEYLFVVNATHDAEGNAMLGLKPVAATLSLPDARSRPFVYDVVQGGVAKAFELNGTVLQGRLRFGPGQMRVLARTARPVGGVALASPIVNRDYTRHEAPLRLELSASVFALPPDAFGYPRSGRPASEAHLLGGSVPLRIVVTDPLGGTRYDLYRATKGGVLGLSLPLALNDPPGEWRVEVTELLALGRQSAAFRIEPTAASAGAAGCIERAVHWPEDRAHVFRFFRTQARVTIVPGTNDFNRPAVERLERILKPWNVTCSVLPAVEANRPRSLSEEEARTWVGLEYAGRGQIRPGASNSPVLAGFALRGPAILLGTPQDNPLIKLLADQRFLPYKPEPASMPGPGRGHVAWQREALGVNQESVTLVAYDAAGMNEAVGSLYEMLAGLEPITPLRQPRLSRILPASRGEVVPGLKTLWTVVLPDRVTGLKVETEQLRVLSHDASLNRVGLQGVLLNQRPLPAPEYTNLVSQYRSTPDRDVLALATTTSPVNRLVKLTAAGQGSVAVAYWGGTVSVFDEKGLLKATTGWQQDLTTLAWVGTDLVIGDADGRLARLHPE